MDPNETLAQMREAYTAGDWLRCAELAHALDDWLSSGAFLPAPWQAYNPPKGEDLTEGAGPDDRCGCGEPITMYEGVWLHVYNEELRGTDDHDPEPG